MKRFFILFTIALAASGAARAQTLHVALNKLYNDSMDFETENARADGSKSKI